MAPSKQSLENRLEIDRLALQLAKDPHSKAFMPLAEAYAKVGMWQEAAAVLEDGLKYYPGFITAMVTLGRAYDQMAQSIKAKAILEEAVKLSPENLRAHRTLVKIYVGQGDAEAALRSCAVILAVNPQDEEALSIQAHLGAPVQQIQTTPALANPRKDGQSASESTRPSPASPRSKETTQAIDSGDAVTAAPPVTQTLLKETCHADSNPAGNNSVDLFSTSLAHAASPPPAAIARLDAWLRTIQLRRRDRDKKSRAQSESS